MRNTTEFRTIIGQADSFWVAPTENGAGFQVYKMGREDGLTGTIWTGDTYRDGVDFALEYADETGTDWSAFPGLELQ